jgi:hypothetical protein
MLPQSFVEKVEIRGPDECWPWRGALCQGYGQFRIGAKIKKAHRLVYEDCHGRLQDNFVVMHKCDNRQCVNPAHLSAGTVKDNNDDRDKKGRQVAKRGEDHGMAVLKEYQVAEILAFKDEINARVAEFAERFGASKVAVRDVLAGRVWSWFSKDGRHKVMAITKD